MEGHYYYCERTCVICSNSRNPNEYEFLDATKEQSIFETVSSYLDVSESHKLWNFFVDPLPFCPRCKDTAIEVESLQRQVEQLRIRIRDKIDGFQEAIVQSSTDKQQQQEISTSRNNLSPIREWEQVSLDFNSLVELSEISSSPSSTTTNLAGDHQKVSERYVRYRQEVIAKNEKGTDGGASSRTCSQPVTNNDHEMPITTDNVNDDLTANNNEPLLNCLNMGGGAGSHSENAHTATAVPVGSEVPDADNDTNDLHLELSSDESYAPVDQVKEPPPISQGWQKKEDGLYFMGIRTIVMNNEMKCLAENCDLSISLMKENCRKRMAYHIKERHYGLKKCPAVGCTRRFLEINKTELEEHIERDHISPSTEEAKNKPVDIKTCSNCLKTYTSKRCFNDHVKICCPTQLEGRRSFKKSSQKEFPCSTCQKVFSRKSNLERHEETHEKPIGQRKVHLCEFCGKGFTLRDGLKDHLKSVHGRK